MRLRDITPKSLFGRMLAIILVPIILVQIISVSIFYERHWDWVSRHMSKNFFKHCTFSSKTWFFCSNFSENFEPEADSEGYSSPEGYFYDNDSTINSGDEISGNNESNNLENSDGTTSDIPITETNTGQ